MRILITSEHVFPSESPKGSGKRPKTFPSGSANHVFDLIAKGLSELGHEVVYCVSKGWAPNASPPFTLVKEPVFDVDVAHVMGYRDEALIDELERRGIPTLVNCHRDPHLIGEEQGTTGANWVYVSASLAAAFGGGRYVFNGLDPEDYIFQVQKQPYLLFMAALEWADSKGLNIALSLAQEAGIKLVVAGTGLTQDIIDQTEARCRANNAEFVGDVRARDKAQLFADAQAFLFPTQIAESFGLCLVEALMSGTPVITSAMGACPELVTPDVGFVCHDRSDYLKAINSIDTISAARCRTTAEQRFHYRQMAASYVREYMTEIERLRRRPSSQIRPNDVSI